jgi:hypothetical protein
MDSKDIQNDINFNGIGEEREPLRILFATEYLPPFVSGISNRCKNWINGYRKEGHSVKVFSVAGSECDIVVPSIANPFYKHQRYFSIYLSGFILI